MSRLLLATSVLLAIPASLVAQQPVSASASPTAAAFAAASDSGQPIEAVFETKDAAALTVGLSPLSKASLKKNEHEVRIWYSEFGNPQFLVVIHQNGSSLTGRLFLWWDQYYESNPSTADARVDNFVRSRYDCGPITKRDSHFGEDSWISSVCEAKIKGTPDWKAFLGEVEAHALPQNGTAALEDHQEGEDWGITVERRSAQSYGLAHYHTDLSLTAPEPGRGPKLQDMVTALASTARREATVAQH